MAWEIQEKLIQIGKERKNEIKIKIGYQKILIERSQYKWDRKQGKRIERQKMTVTKMRETKMTSNEGNEQDITAIKMVVIKNISNKHIYIP